MIIQPRQLFYIPREIVALEEKKNKKEEGNCTEEQLPEEGKENKTRQAA